MIGAWLARRAGVESLAGRIDALERDLAEARVTILSLYERMTVAEAREAAAIERLNRQSRVFARIARSGAIQLRRLRAGGAGHEDRAASVESGLARLTADMLIANQKIEEEAIQARRGTTELFRRIEAMRPRGEADASR